MSFESPLPRGAWAVPLAAVRLDGRGAWVQVAGQKGPRRVVVADLDAQLAYLASGVEEGEALELPEDARRP